MCETVYFFKYCTGIKYIAQSTDGTKPSLAIMDIIVHTEVDDIDFIVHTEVDDIDFLDFMVLVPNIEAIRLCLLEFEPFGRSVLVLSNSANLAVPS